MRNTPMQKKTKMAVAHSDGDLGKSGEYSRARERCAMGADTRAAMDMCGVTEVAARTGV